MLSSLHQQCGHSLCLHLTVISCEQCALIPLTWHVQGVEKLLRSPAETARLSFTARLGWQRALLQGLAESATTIADFLGHPWRSCELPPDEHCIISLPSQHSGSMRSPLFQEVMGTL